MLKINRDTRLPDEEILITPIRASGPGGQNVNKVSSAVHLRFDINRSSLPARDKQALLAYSDQRITRDGVINIKANEHRSLQLNTEAARERLVQLIRTATAKQKTRIATRPSRSARRKRLDSKKRHGQTKALRGKVRE